MQMMMRNFGWCVGRTGLLGLVLLATFLSGCRANQPEPPAEMPPADPIEQAPWQRGALEADEVAPVYLEQWRRAENRDECALIAPMDLGQGAGASARLANFSGGWGIAYDTPGLRSAFGVAGTGVDAAAPSYDEWPYNKQWPDGSSVGFGPEGGSGPNQLAYLRISGQQCLYNMWSRLGTDHLEYLLEHLRFVQTSAAER